MNSNDDTKNEDVKTERGGCSRRRLWKIPFIIAAIALIKSGLVMVLWNAIIPDLFHGPILSYPQAIGITVLAHLLVGFRGPPFGGRFGGGHGGPPWARGEGPWGKMTDEQREKLREKLRSRGAF